MTPRALIRLWADRFAAAGVPDPLVDAAALLAHVTRRPPLSLRLDSETTLPAETEDRFTALAEQRLRRIPLQHLLGTQPFLGRDFQVSAAALIPRPETEALALMAIEALQQTPLPRRALDLCCGTGCIGISLKLACPEAEVTCADISADAIAVCRANAEALSADILLKQGDLFDAAGGRYAVIVSNPPYIPSADCDTLQPEVLLEPRLALDGGADGLAFYRRIAAEAADFLTPGGALLLEIGCEQAADATRLLREAGFRQVSVTRDDAGLDRIITARRAA
ncbi:MAG: peptide chain release factor N(5)-glutamine methyltransferase [Clostridia bacterium]|nr:peptide chain release factor N(5)-glutamine methyltransferase [Clostridia bacterium]